MRSSAPLALVVALGACAEPAPPTDPVVTISSKNASWAAVRVGDAWTRFDDLPLTFAVAPGARYDVVVVCRTDIGQGWSLIGATAEDRAFDRSCEGFQPGSDAGAIPVDVQVTGRVDYVFVGDHFVTSSATMMLTPGTYDVIAHRTPRAATPDGRVQVLRDVVIDGPRRIDIDLDLAGSDLPRAQVWLDGAPTTATYSTLTTRTGALMWTNFPARVLPPGLARDTDRVDLHVLKAGYWADLEYRGLVQLAAPTEAPTATFRWEPVPTADVTAEGTWDWITLDLRDALGVATWRVIGQPDVIAAEGAIAIEHPPFADWNPAWLPDPEEEFAWEVRWERARPGGREGRRVFGP